MDSTNGREQNFMDIYPQDLGNSNYANVLNIRRISVRARHRLTPKTISTSPSMPWTPMRKLWTYGFPIDDQVAEYATPAFDVCNSAAVQWIPADFRWTFVKMLVFAFLVLPLEVYILPFQLLYYGWLKPRMIMKEMHQRLNHDDLLAVANATSDPLAVDFFKLVEAAVHMPGVVSQEDSEKMRAALYSLGNSISLLPMLEVTTQDAARLKAEAQSLVGQAKTEPDPVVAASFQRRADAILQRAASADHSNTILRRSQVLRDELREQIWALRASMTTTTLNTDHHAGRLADVAANIQQIAGQANSVAAAQAELENAYLQAVPLPSSVAQAQRIQISRRQI